MDLERLRHRLRRLRALPIEIARLPRVVEELCARLEDDLPRLFEILQVVYDEERDNRRRLTDLRNLPDYEAAFTEDEPLVSVVIPTYTSYETLRDRALPSLLAQTYGNLEVVVVGDCAPPETSEVVRGFGDDRIVYENLPIRGPYPEDPFDRWNVSGVPAYNAAVRRSHGRWISPFSDDDALRPHALETVVRAAQRARHEVCYGVVDCRLADGRRALLGAFPPEHGGFALQGGIYHGGLRFIEHELADALFRTPHDWGMARRMLRAGVRFGFVDEVLCDYYPTSNPRGGFDPALFDEMRRRREQQAAHR